MKLLQELEQKEIPVNTTLESIFKIKLKNSKQTKMC